MKKVKKALFFAIFCVLVSTPTLSKSELRVVASIKPIHSLVAAVMQGAGAPDLIIDGVSSPHAYAMRPSQARNLQNADVIFWVGPELEAFLEKSVATTGQKATSVPLIDHENMIRKEFRDHDDHDHANPADKGDNDSHNNEKNPTDPHIWLDPVNAKTMVRVIADTLSQADPAAAARYRQNAVNLTARLAQLTADVAATLAPLKDKKYIVFHDAYQYFEARFGMASVGALTLNPDVLPGAEHLRDMKQKVAALGATCVFSEPQFKPKLVSLVIEGTAAKSSVLDPLGASIPAGPDQYFKLITDMAAAMRKCLS